MITGAKKESDLTQALTKIHPVLVEFKKTHVASLPGIPTPTSAAGVSPNNSQQQAFNKPKQLAEV